MGFRIRLALFLIATLIAVQLLTAALVHTVTRRELIDEGGRQLARSAGAFGLQLQDLSARVADNVQVLSLDYALRAAIAQHDQATILSVLRNHGRRVGAARMMLLGIDGTIQADTGGAAPGSAFRAPHLVHEALERPSAAVVAADGRVYWTVVVPVFAPALIGMIAADIPVDDPLLARMQEQSAVPRTIELVTREGGEWVVAAQGATPVPLAAALREQEGERFEQPLLVPAAGREYVAYARRLSRPGQEPPVLAVLGYSLDEALQPYEAVARAWTGLLALGLLVGLAGALFIARNVSRPVEALAATARRIGEGDYTPPPPLTRRDEIGQLSSAFANMARAIGEREERIRHQAGHDAITGLANRLAAEPAIQQDLARAASGALLMIGLARLPETVKTLGHALSDRLMGEAGRRLRQRCGEALLARTGDTQFAVWLPGVERAEAIAQAFRALDALAVPYQEADLSIDIAPAVGVALAPAHGAQASLLLQRAEVALFGALAAEDKVAVYDPATDPHRPERLSLMGDLREALDQGQLQLHYQPKLNLATGIVDSAEGLLRWQHPRCGMIPPDTFIGMAEETGNIRPLTRWVVAAGVVQARDWFGAGRPLRVAVNVSPRDFEDAELPRRIGELLAVHGLAPEALTLEVTERAVMGEPDAAVQVMRRLAEQGVNLAIDDFGVGQSSLAYLHRLPVRELKIDKTFVRELRTSAGDRTIVRSIVELGHRMHYKVTAEGVEDRAALDYLASIGCDHAQGFHVSRPLPAAEFDRLLADGSLKAPSLQVGT